MSEDDLMVDAIMQAFGLRNNTGVSCRDYVADHGWMDRSGNLCWGFGAGDQVPCINCGVRWAFHYWDELDDDDPAFARLDEE